VEDAAFHLLGDVRVGFCSVCIIGSSLACRYPLLGLLRIGFMMSFAYQFIWSLESPMGDPTMVWGKRLLLANKVIFYPVHGLEVQIHLQLPLHLYASLEMVLFGTILAVDWNHCTRAALGMTLDMSHSPRASCFSVCNL
jgi:hypothetical protein